MVDKLTDNIIKEFKAYLIEDEKSAATIEKYMRSVMYFAEFTGGRRLTKTLVMEYRDKLLADSYSERSVNAILAGINSLLHHIHLDTYRIKALRIQKPIYSSEDRELTRTEYLKLLGSAKDNKRLYAIIETTCATGIRVSELKWFTIENIRAGEIHIRNKGKSRVIIISGKLRKKLIDYARTCKITSGAIFRNSKGNTVNRSVVWAMMKKLCTKAGVSAAKVYPHNLRKLFARCFYKIDKDIAKLADVLGHSSINTTRIYIMSTGREHRKIIDQMGLVV